MTCSLTFFVVPGHFSLADEIKIIALIVLSIFQIQDWLATGNQVNANSSK